VAVLNVSIYINNDLRNPCSRIWLFEPAVCVLRGPHRSIVDGTCRGSHFLPADSEQHRDTAGHVPDQAPTLANSANYGRRQFTLHVFSDPLLTITTGFALPIGNANPRMTTLAARGTVR
jgi:hypothetical protein